MNMQLKTTPPKDGMTTQYACGFIAWGSWASRIEKWKAFKKTDTGKYILKLEKIARRAKK